MVEAFHADSCLQNIPMFSVYLNDVWSFIIYADHSRPKLAHFIMSLRDKLWVFRRGWLELPVSIQTIFITYRKCKPRRSRQTTSTFCAFHLGINDLPSLLLCERKNFARFPVSFFWKRTPDLCVMGTLPSPLIVFNPPNEKNNPLLCTIMPEKWS